jgi:hypothetical protein
MKNTDFYVLWYFLWIIVICFSVFALKGDPYEELGIIAIIGVILNWWLFWIVREIIKNKKR